MSTPDVIEKDGEHWLSPRGIVRMIALTPPEEVKAGPSRDWIVDFQKRRPEMTETEAIREALKRIGCEHLMPKPRLVEGGAK